MKKILYRDDAQDCVVLGKEMDGIDNWDERFCGWLADRGQGPAEWDYQDLGEFFREYGYDTVEDTEEDDE